MDELPNAACKTLFKENAKRVMFKSFGEPKDVLNVAVTNVSFPNKNEIIVKMTLSSINPSDLLAIRGVGSYRERISLPAIAGFEGVGTVVALGEEVNSLKLGQRVLTANSEGTWQEYVKLPAENAIPVPDEIDDKTAAQLYINPLTTWLIIKRLKLGKDNIIIANAANSAMGKLFAQFSKVFGYTYIAVVRSNEYIEMLLKLGAARVITTGQENLLQKVLEFTNGKKPDVALEAIGGAVGLELAKTVNLGGKVLIYGNLSLENYSYGGYAQLQLAGIRIENFWLRDWVSKASIVERNKTFEELLSCIIKNKIIFPVAKIFGLTEIEVKQAVTEAEKSGLTGKILLSQSGCQL